MAGPPRADAAAGTAPPGLRAVLGKHADLALAAAVVTIVAMMIVPLPTIVLDLFIVANMAAAVVLLLVAIYVTAALEIASFPTLLLLTTLFRLALEVSATRLILLHGDGGTVIHAFGNFVVAGNLVVGAVIFFILTMIQFIVIAKGSERVSEVGARFTLDAMPGKQMSIDAELRSGHIDHGEARQRRAALARESQFFGAMDGAMKFVKGDAIAGIIVLLTNIVGGLLIGIVQRGMDAAQAAHVYTVLTIGQGLVAQIPALIISTAAGIIVTRVASEEEGGNLGREIFAQLTGQPKAIAIAAALMILLAVVPGFPTLPFLLLAAGLGFLAWHLIGAEKPAAVARATISVLEPGQPTAAPSTAAAANSAANLPSPVRVPIYAELSSALTDAFFPDGNPGNFFDELVAKMRGEFFADLGLLLPGLRIRSHSAQLKPNQYRFLLNEVPTEAGTLVLEGDLDAATPTPQQAMLAHLARVLRRHASEFIGIEETQALLDALARSHPALVKEVVPKLISLTALSDILKRLVEEGVSIRALVNILQTLAKWAPIDRDPVALTEHVRGNLRRQIVSRYTDASGGLAVCLLDPMIEEAVRESIQRTPTGTYLALDPSTSRNIVKAIASFVADKPGSFVILTSAEIRRFVRRLIEAELPQLAVLSYQELTPETKLQQLGRISAA